MKQIRREEDIEEMLMKLLGVINAPLKVVIKVMVLKLH